MDAFGVLPLGKEYKTSDYLDQSAFDEKFEIDPEHDYIQNIYHVENKYSVPVLAGGYRDMYAYCRDNLIYPGDREFGELMDPDTLEKRLQASEPPGMVKGTFREKLVDGSFRWVQYIGISGADQGVPEGKIYFYVFDIQNQKDRLEGKLSSMYSNFIRNQITGLRTRRAFEPDAMELVRSESGPWCCLAFDIQHFKLFNSWYGYEKGDYLLSRIGSYLLDVEREEKVVAAYFGRDAFAVVMRHDEDRISRMFSDIREIVFSYCEIPGFLPAFGICLMDEDEKRIIDVYDRAREAVQEAKKNYRDRIRYFDSRKYARTQENYKFLAELQSALTNGEISFYVQPQCRISKGGIVGGEALARWIRKDGTIINPGAFTPILESSGVITELDKSIWESVCRWLRSLIDRNITPVPISVNVSQVDLMSMDIAAFLQELTDRFQIPAGLLKVEITESAYAADFERITQTIAGLKSRGFSVFLDDFGSGYSSLNMLDKINVDLIKLDMAFMRKENNNLSKKGISIVESIFGMTKAIELPVIVEGVETDKQILFLKDLGCRYVQGYFFYRPVSPRMFEELLRDPVKVDYSGFRSRTTELFQAKEFLNENMFTDSTLNHILGAVAYYSLEGRDLTITRYNELFHQAISDEKMDDRRISIQNYVVAEDRPILYQALEAAEDRAADGSRCDIRFYKSDNSVFWFHMRFFFVKEDGTRKLFFGQVEDVTQLREQNIYFFEVLRKQAEATMRLDLDQNTIQYITGEHTLYQLDLPSMNLDDSLRQTVEKRIAKEADKRAFLDFFNPDRLREAYRKAIYHEVLSIEFQLEENLWPVEFSTYYFRYSKDQSLTVYAFLNRRTK